MAINEQEAHKWFAVECNNQAWDLWEQPELSPEQAQQMIDIAHAGRFHWSKVGTEINDLRALTLLACAYIKAGNPQQGLDYAKTAEILCNKLGEDKTAFDQACVQAARARGYDAMEEHKSAIHRQAAQQLAEQIEDEGDREYFLNSLLNYAPWNLGG